MSARGIAQIVCFETNISLLISIISLAISILAIVISSAVAWKYKKLSVKNLKEKIRKTLFGEKLYKEIKENGLNVLVETEGSKAKTNKRRFLINVFLTIISTLAAVIAAIFAALAYFNT